MGRIRSIDDIDLSTANAKCPKCNGTGVSGNRTIEVKDAVQIVPVICSCVCDAGGVRPDALDKHAMKVQQSLEEGTFVPKTVDIILRMDEKARMMALDAYEQLLARPMVTPEAKRIIALVVEQVEAKLKERGGSESVH